MLFNTYTKLFIIAPLSVDYPGLEIIYIDPEVLVLCV